MPLERIDKIIASQGELSRSDAKKLLSDGAVAVNGKQVRDCSFKADIDADIVCIHGKPLRSGKYIYIMLNKPTGVVSASRSSGKGEKTVVELVPRSMKRSGLFPAGRLDSDSTGFVLITDDGEFAHRILSPSNHVEKTYEVTLSHQADIERYTEAFSKGLVLSDGTRLLSADVRMLSDGERPVLEVVLREGRYHQIKRMFAALGNHVEALRRTKIGGLELDAALPEGECRELTAEEVSEITQKPNW
ncbi:MAG: rRNA pseudouridine synthase [Clostridiales bacterium]|nr:rRNA pseudouridine synthase [Clostridiales bacterium]